MSEEDIINKINSITNEINNNPTDSKLIIERAKCYYEIQDMDKCLIDALKAKSLNPKNPDSYYYAFHAYWSKNDYLQAESNINECIKTLEANIGDLKNLPRMELHKFYHFRGVFNFELQKFHDAIHDFLTAIELNKYLIRTHLKLGQSYYKLYNYESALETFKNALELIDQVRKQFPDEYKDHQDEPLLWAEIGNIHAINNKFDLGEFAYTNVITLTNGKDGYLERAGRIYLQTNNLKKAEKDFQVHKKMYPNDYRPYNYYGKYYLRIGDYSRSIDEFNIAIALDSDNDPNKFLLYFNRANAYFYSKDYKHAIEDFTSTIEKNKYYQDHQAYLNRGNCYKDINEVRKALEDYLTAIKVKPDYKSAYLNAGLTYQELGEFDKAIDCFEKLVSFDPEKIDVLLSLAILYYEKQPADYEKSEEKFKLLQKLSPGNAGVLEYYAVMLHRKGERDKSQQIISAILQKLPQERKIIEEFPEFKEYLEKNPGF